MTALLTLAIACVANDDWPNQFPWTSSWPRRIVTEPKLTVDDGGDDPNADVKLFMPADIADKYWRGEYNLAVGLAKGQVKAKGPVNKILKLVPLTKPLFPMYRERVAEKDAVAAV